MNKKKYSSSIKKTPFKYQLSKKIAKLIVDDFDKNEIMFKCIEENYIEIPSIVRRKEITNVIYDRLCKLDKYLINQFVYADINTSKFILVYAIAKADALFFEFMFEVYRESLLNEKKYISLDDFDNFFLSKQQQNITVSEWGKYTIDQLAKGYRNILVESNLGNRIKKNISTNKVIIHPDVIEHIIKLNDKIYIEAILGGQ